MNLFLFRNEQCPTCFRKIINSKDIHKVFLPNISINEEQVDSRGDLLNSEIFATRVIDLELSKNKMESKLDEVLKQLDMLSLNFSKLESENENRIKENKALKLEIAEIKSKPDANADQMDELYKNFNEL